MPKSKQQKKQIFTDLAVKIKQAKSLIFASFTNLTVGENEELRKQLKAADGEYYVAKKTLFNLALREAEIKGIEPKNFSGQLAIAFGYGDEVAPAKVISKFAKAHPYKLEFVGGFWENRFIEPEAVKTLANLPGKQELYARLVSSINAPVSGLVNALAGNLRNLVYVLSAMREKRSN